MALLLPRRKAALDIADVFHIETRTGNGSSATVTSGFEPAFSITKARSTSTGWRWVHSPGTSLDSSSTAAEATEASGVTAFNSDGMSLGSDADYNANTVTFVDYLFDNVPGFSDVVTYTGNGTAGRTISHNLGVAPGMIVVKNLDSAEAWGIYHRSLGGTKYLRFDTAAASTSIAYWDDTDPTDSVFTVDGTGGYSGVNTNAQDYVAYLFAHDTTDNGVIQCGSYTGNGSSSGPTVTLGWEPQWVMIKRASGGAANWAIADTTRDTSPLSKLLFPNASTAESSFANFVTTSSTGFQLTSTSSTSNVSGNTYIYVAIRAEGV